MVIEMRQKSQVTIPSEIVKSLGINVGDQFEVVEKNGVICLIPVILYPKKYVEDLEKEVATLKKGSSKEEQKVFNNLEDLFKSLDDK